MYARLAATVMGTVLAGIGAAGVAPVDQVDLGRYAGTWYEQASFPMFFQRKCVAGTTANYTLKEHGRVRVINTCIDSSGAQLRVEGEAKSASDTHSRLKVRFAPRFLSFLPFVWADYWVIGLDPNYQWAIVGTPNRKYLWLLARKRQLDASSYARLITIAKEQGFDTTRLVRTKQL